MIQIAVVLLFVCSNAAADNGNIDFGQDVFPILRRSCLECHGKDRQEGELRLDSNESLVASQTVIAGSPETSEFIRRIALPAGHHEAMPAVGDPLSAKDQATLVKWVKQGADWPASFTVGKHWSYIVPVRPPLPAIPDSFADFPRNEIDYFVAARLHEIGLKASTEAAPETLIRRVFLDLIGLPPTPEEVNAFAAAPSDEAYEQMVDELLQRPQFGERWARPWLDLARYADSHGFQRDNLRDVWAYRDWVIRALNNDMPFDRFTIEQIAGDLLPNASESQKIATGFHRCTPTNVEAGSLPEETRIEQVIDRVNTTGAVWLGTTMECCQCHDHKYDPFSAKDYYGLLAFFNNTEMEADRTNPMSPSSIKFNGPKMEISNPELDKQREELLRRITALKTKLADRKTTLSKDLAEWAAQAKTTLVSETTIHPLEVVRFSSRGKTDTHEVLDDGSVLLVGDEPAGKDTYQVDVRCSHAGVTAFRLDVLTHKSLPGTGPGRGDAQSTNFVLNAFKASTSGATNDKPIELKFRKAFADFSQANYGVSGAIGDKQSKGWAIAPQFKKPHWATFILEKPLSCTEQQTVRFTLDQQFGRARTIGRFRISAVTGNPEGDAFPAAMANIVKASPDKWTAQQKQLLASHRIKQDEQFQRMTRQVKDTQKQIDALAPDTTLVMIELEASKSRQTYVFERGDYKSPGEAIQPATPKVLHPMPAGPVNRLSLARWLVDRSNPLVARVTVNRWWAEIFGNGIVPTLEDFGLKGDQPSHPELLDWLAVDFMDNDWSMKSVLKKIVLSATYRQSSAISPKLLERDDANKLLARGPRFRMDAEMIRDNLLSIAGLLDTRQFGESIRPYQPAGIWSKVGGENYKYKISSGTEQYRRGVYVVIKRGAPYPSFINFDATARLSCTVQRSRTNTPLQALTILNDPVYVEAAKALAVRVLNSGQHSTNSQRVRFAFQLCAARQPTQAEMEVLLDLLETQTSINRTRPDLVSLAETGLPSGISPAEFNAWQSVTTTLLNLHETITKN